MVIGSGVSGQRDLRRLEAQASSRVYVFNVKYPCYKAAGFLVNMPWTKLQELHERCNCKGNVVLFMRLEVEKVAQLTTSLSSQDTCMPTGCTN